MWFLASCDHVRERLSAFEDGELGIFERLRVRAHLSMCRACARVYRGLLTTLVALETLRHDTSEQASERTH